MQSNQYSDLLLEQSKDFIWAVDQNFCLIYANRACRDMMKKVRGEEIELNTSVLVDGFGEEVVKKWKGYYLRALSGEFFEIEENFHNPKTRETQYGLINFSPIKLNNDGIQAVSCRSSDITSAIRQKDHASRLMDASLDVFCTINDQGNFEYVSEAAKSHWGYEPEELTGLPYISLVIEEDLSKTSIISESIISGKEVKSFVNRYKKKNGSIAYNLWSARYDKESKLIYCVARDAKETLEQKQLLKRSEERFKSLVQEGTDLIAILDQNGNYIYVTPTSTSILGIPPEDFLGKNAFDFIHPDDIEKSLPFLQKINVEKIVKVEPYRFQNKRGEWRWLETILTNMLDNPVVGGIVANSRDVTEKIEEAHRLKLFEKALNSTTDSIIITDAEPLDEPGPVIQYVNEAFTKVTGYTREEVIGKNPRILQGPGTNFNELENLGKKLRRWEPTELTVLNYTKNSVPFWVNFVVSPVADEKGRFTHWISVQRDVTKHKNIEFEQRLLAKISICFGENELPQAGEELCKVIKDFGDFDLVELWCPNLEKTQLSRIAFNCTFKEFEINYNFKSHVLKGEGLQGKVWEQRKQLLWDQEIISTSFIRKNEAANAGLKHVLGVPLSHNNQINGVLVIGSGKNAKGLSKLSNIIENLETFIGSEINRKSLEDSLKKLYETIPEILCITDFNGRILKINPAGCTLLGYTEEEVLFRSFNEFVHPEDIDLSINELKNLEKGASTFQFENRNITKEGRIIWLSWNCNLSIEDGLIYAAAKNITEEKKLRSLIKQTNSMAKIGPWEVDIEKGTLYWSDMVHELHGTDPNSFVPDLNSAIEFYREDFRPMVIAAIEKAFANGSYVDFEAIIVTKNLKERWVRAIGKAEQSNGVTKRFLGSFQDIHVPKSLELQIKEILESISDAFYALDANWNFTYFNREAENLLKKSAKEVLGGNIWEIFSPAKGTILEVIYKRVGLSGHSENFEYFYPGDKSWYEITAYPSNGGVSSYFKNIDGRRKSARELEKAYKEKNEILESISDAFFAVDKEWTVTYWNNQAETLLGRLKKDIVGKNIWGEFPDAIDTDFYRNYHKSMKSGETINFEEYYLDLDIWLEVTVYPSENGLSIYFKDISHRKAADIRLMEANERFELATKATNDFIWDWDITNDIFHRPNNIQKLFGKKVSTKLKKNQFWQDSFHAEDLEALKESIDRTLKDPRSERWEMEYRIINDQDEELYIIDRGIIVRNKKGKAVRMVGAMTDLTKQKRLEMELFQLNESLKIYAKELERSNEELEQFAFITSHDLQEPLRMISSFMDQLKRKYGNQMDEKALQYIHFAMDGAKRMKQIILDLLHFSRANKPTEPLEEVNLNEIVTEYKQLRRKLIDEKNASITIETLPALETHKAAITQIFHCLLDNALKYVKENKSVRVEILVKEKEKEWEFAVKDNGIGIDSIFFDKIFVIFQRLHNRSQYDGTGIGLSIAKRSVEFLGGKIWLESTVGKGSVFYFTISKTNNI